MTLLQNRFVRPAGGRAGWLGVCHTPEPPAAAGAGAAPTAAPRAAAPAAAPAPAHGARTAAAAAAAAAAGSTAAAAARAGRAAACGTWARRAGGGTRTTVALAAACLIPSHRPVPMPSMLWHACMVRYIYAAIRGCTLSSGLCGQPAVQAHPSPAECSCACKCAYRECKRMQRTRMQ